jgi:hypothetical protein
VEHQSASVWSVCTVTVPVRYRTHFAAVAVALPLYRTLPARHFIHVSVPLLSRWYSVCWCECTNCNFTLNVSDTQRARRSQRATRLPGGVQQARAHAFASNAYERLREVWIEQVASLRTAATAGARPCPSAGRIPVASRVTSEALRRERVTDGGQPELVSRWSDRRAGTRMAVNKATVLGHNNHNGTATLVLTRDHRVAGGCRARPVCGCNQVGISLGLRTARGIGGRPLHGREVEPLCHGPLPHVLLVVHAILVRLPLGGCSLHEALLSTKGDHDTKHHRRR